MFEDLILAQTEPHKLEDIDGAETVTSEDGSTNGNPAGEGQETKPPGLGSMWPLLIMIVALYFIMIMGPKKKEKERKNMLSELKKNDKVRTIGGMIGTVVEVREKEVLVKIDESNNTRVKFVRDAIGEIIKDEK